MIYPKLSIVCKSTNKIEITLNLYGSVANKQFCTYRFRVVLFGATCLPYFLQEILQTHFAQNMSGHLFLNKFYVDNYLNTYENESDLINDKVT